MVLETFWTSDTKRMCFNVARKREGFEGRGTKRAGARQQRRHDLRASMVRR